MTTKPFTTLGNKIHCTRLRDELNQVLRKYGVDANLEFKVGAMKFTPMEVDIKLSAKIVGAPSREERILESALVSYRLREDNGNGEKIVGFHRSRYKYPFVIQRGAKQYKCDLRYLERNGFSTLV